MQRSRILILSPRYITLTTVVVAALACVLGLLLAPGAWPWLLPLLALFGGLVALGFRDLFHPTHSILRSYPIAAHLRFIMEEIRPEMRQYFFEDEKHGTPFSRDKRAVVYQRAKNQLDKRPFGTQYDVYQDGFEWLHHSMAPRPVAHEPPRVLVGGPDCTLPYSASLLNISAMSFGSLSASAIRALNQGAKAGGFAHDTGEGGLSPYHKEAGGDLIWELGSGYFSARDAQGRFDPALFAANATLPQVRMVELKLSQGAKPGHGGVLPAAKVSAEIAATRGVPMGVDCISPAAHAAFSTPVEMLHFIAEMRRLSGGKPAGFKLCIGHRWEFLAICKAMVETGITPDFIVVDGAEGGTGAAPLEFMDHLGMPMREGLNFVHNALIGVGLRDRIRLGASGKIASAFDMARALALGADWCNAGRGFMFALGCIHSLSCHTDRCPTGVATQDPTRSRALVVPDKAQRVAQFQAATVAALAELVAAAGLDHPGQLRPHHFFRRVSAQEVRSFAELFPELTPGELLAGTADARFREAWAMADAHSFAPRMPVTPRLEPEAA
ncbi:FMN-binding glutamate synthase family protein [Falsiroseomonas selenitidurans]|uniref:FMN-binding glutamate synthase family protein n=1 Tax=Falsiroseomonas selenitidurans TaxID=2716335 RepID=A0ABX1E0I2_9PROT|nr:FMN-binding glutamate synthase family protein [Falsiroseomonas selenitidurans]NKC30603.1 FMN-binding glutamate synthase family protein [Falsiroseomonas selenitidurans]OYW10639.1 MAG: FMN-binding glutamate synthase family protein [Rhodospirillales bacterium 12-71-4]